MLSSLYSNGAVQIILLIVAAPLWWPVVRLIKREINAAADIAETHVRWASGRAPAALSDEQSARARASAATVPPGHGVWDGPRRLQPAPLAQSADVERGSIAEKVMAASERGARGFGRRPI